MASIVGELKALLGLDKSKYDKGMKDAEKQGDKLGKALKKIGGIIAGAFAVGALKAWGQESLRLYDKQKKAEQGLLVALKGRRDIQERLIAQSKDLQKKTLYGDEQSIEAAGRLAMNIGADENAIRKLLPLVQDFATAKFGGNIISAADLIAKSIGSSTNALTRYGIEITGAVGSSERLETAIAGLNKQVGGQAEAAANVGTGALTKLKNAWGDFRERIGAKIIPVLNKLADFGMRMLDDADKQSVALIKEQSSVNTLVSAITNENTSREVRKSLIDELQKQYPDFLGNLDKEKVTNKDLRDRLSEVNEEYGQRIKLAVQQELVNKQARDYADSVVKEAEYTKKLEEATRQLAETRASLALPENIGYYADLKKAEEQESMAVDDLNSRIQKQRDFRQELNDKNAEAIKLLDIYKSKASSGSSGGGSMGVVPSGGGGSASSPADITRMAGPEMAGISHLTELSNELAPLNDKLQDTSKHLNAAQEAAGLWGEEMIAAAADGQLSLKNFASVAVGTAKKVISSYIAEGVAGAVKNALNLPFPFGFAAAGIAAGLATAAFNSLIPSFAYGGTVPSGYPNDTYPAMLTSGERILTPSQNRQYESGGTNINVTVEGIQRGGDIYYVVKEYERKKANSF